MLLHSQHRFHRHNSRHSLSPLNLRCLPAVVFRFRTCSRCRWGVIHRTDYCTCRHRLLYCSDCISKGITKIVLHWSTRWWKPCTHQSLHAPSRTVQRFCVNTPRAPRAVLSSSWRHLWRHQCHVSPSYVSIQSSTDVSATSSCWRHLMTIYFDRPLTFLQSWLFSVQVLLTQFFA